jgi:hypothetical protein
MAEILAEAQVSDRRPTRANFLHLLHRGVGATVVNEQNLRVPMFELTRGSLQASNEYGEVVGLVMHWDNDAQTLLPLVNLSSCLVHDIIKDIGAWASPLPLTRQCFPAGHFSVVNRDAALTVFCSALLPQSHLITNCTQGDMDAERSSVAPAKG